MEENSRITKEKITFDSPSAITLTDDEGPETFPAHWHNAAEFTLFLKDNCKYRVSGKLYQLNAGDIILAWPHQIHETVMVPRGGALFIQFSSTIIESNLDLVSISRFLYEKHSIFAKSEPELAEFIHDKIYEIKKIHTSSDPLSETKCKVCIYDILLKIGEKALEENKNRANEETGVGWDYIHAACRYIVENATENLTQADVAASVGLSTFYFSKLFKQHMHMSFPAYLASIRVRTAASLLMDESLSITECAFQAGFQSTTAFNRTFHDVTGYSPRDYRKLYR